MSVSAPAAMTLEQLLETVLEVARTHASRVDAEAVFPTASVETCA
jgi:hypothetical protein